jgi:hypothetical protein
MTEAVELRSLVNEAVELSDSDRADIAALQLAVDLTLDNDPPHPGKVKQVKGFLNGYGNEPPRSLWEVARFCAYHQQVRRLELRPWMSPPCWIATREAAEAILAKGTIPAADNSGNDVSDCGPARLVLDMLDAGVSAWHPDPVKAVAEARQTKRKRSSETKETKR